MNVSTYKIIAVIFILFCFFPFSKMQSQVNHQDFAVLVNATAVSSPPSITLKWKKCNNATNYEIRRKTKSLQYWSSILATLDKATLSWTDTTIQKGTYYEYEVRSRCSATYSGSLFKWGGTGYVSAAVELPPIDSRGEVMLLVDDSLLQYINDKLTRLSNDLSAEGWTVTIRTAPRTTAFNKDNVARTKKIIMDEYNNKSSNLKTVFIIGRVAVPYSGLLNPDGHPDHLGAWPADTYYGDVNENWTDLNVSSTVASDPRNKNIVGDGKFDQSNFNAMELQIGRVDFYNLPDFTTTEVELIKKYLDKDHAYRSGNMPFIGRGLIDSNFGLVNYNLTPPPLIAVESFASSGWRNFGSLCEIDSVRDAKWFATLATNTYLWAYGCGGGNYYSASGVGSDKDFASTKVNAIFTMLFGSYFGDWDHSNAFMRSALASDPSVLTCCWSARPHWYFHHMGLNDNIGYSTLISQNNSTLYCYIYYYEYAGTSYGAPEGYNQDIFGNTKSVHMSLLGDPTLTMFPGSVPGPTNLSVKQLMYANVALNWETPSGDNGLSYQVLKSANQNGPWVKVNNTLIPPPASGTSLSYTDVDTTQGQRYYLVRSSKLETSFSGSFWRYGGADSANIKSVSVEEPTDLSFSMQAVPNPAITNVNISFVITMPSIAILEIYDMKGVKVRNLVNEELAASNHLIAWNLLDNSGARVPSGVYFARLNCADRNAALKIVVMP